VGAGNRKGMGVIVLGILMASQKELLFSSLAKGLYVLITKHGARKVLFD
jgi:hypothetical protein